MANGSGVGPGPGRFEGQVALVTGGGRGLGRAIAVALAAEGAAVCVAARTAAQCDETAAAIGATGGRAIAASLDVTDAVACDAVVARIEAELGRPSLVVNSAGICPTYNRAEIDDTELFATTVSINLNGSFNVTRACARALLDGGGAVLMVSSTTGLQASPRLAAYAASKAGLVNLTRTLAREWGNRGVRVNAICPGYVLTEMTAPVLEHEHLGQRIRDATPIGRTGETEEVVAPALFLLSPAASYVTGAWLAVDGGMSA